VSYAEILFDDSYAAGGESLTPANLGLQDIWHASVVVDTATTTPTAMWFAGYDIDNEKLFALGYDDTLGLYYVEGTTDLSSLKVRVKAEGY